MADQNYEIDIEQARDDDEMQVDNDTAAINRKGRGFVGNSGDSQLDSRNGKTSSANPTHATAVRCTSLSPARRCQRMLTV
jgi:hypothetical protein